MARRDGCMSTDSEPRTRRRSKAIGGQLIGLAISVGCIAFVATKIDFAALGQALLHFERPWIAAGLTSLVFGYAMRIGRWAMMLRAAGAEIRISACAAPFLGSIALNNVLPFRAGDAVRALVFPARLGVERTTAMASLLLERMMDLAALVLCLGIGMALVDATVELPKRLQHVIVVASIGASAVLAFLLFASPWIARLLDAAVIRGGERWPGVVLKALGIAAVIFHRMAAMSRPRILVRLSVLSIPVWIGEAGLYFALMLGLNVSIGFAGALTVMAITTLSTLVPSTPGYIGPFHLAAFAAASMLGSDAAQAGAFAVLAHFTLWAATTLAGAIAIATHRELFEKAAPVARPA